MKSAILPLSTIAFWLFTFAAGLGPSMASERKPTVDELLAKHLAALGGVEAHHQQQTRKVESTITYGATKEVLKVTSFHQAPGKMHTRVKRPGKDELVVIVDGQQAWEKKPYESFRQLEGSELKEKLRDARFYGSLEMMTEGDLVLEGQEELDGAANYVLRCTHGPESSWWEGSCTIYLDRTTHLISRIVLPLEGYSNVDTIVADFGGSADDYLTVDGIRHPASLAVSYGPNLVYSMTFDAVTHGVEIEDGLFAPPSEP